MEKNNSPFAVLVVFIAQISISCSAPQSEAQILDLSADGAIDERAAMDSGILGIAEAWFNPVSGNGTPAWNYLPNHKNASRYSADSPPLQFVRLISSGSRKDVKYSYVWSTMEFRNSQREPLTNVSLFAINENRKSVAGTAFGNIRNNAGGIVSDPDVVHAIMASHGMKLNDGALRIDLAEANFQAFTPYESQTIEDVLRLDGDIDDDDDVLEFGYVFHNAAGERRIAPGESAFITLAALIPNTPPSAPIPSTWSGAFVMAVMPTTRVTRGPEESTSAALAHAKATPNVKEVVLIGDDSDSIGPELTPIRMSSISTFQPPDMPEATIDSSGGLIKLGKAQIRVPAGATMGTKFRLERLSASALPAPLPTDRDLPSAVDSRTVGIFRISASSTDFEKPIHISIPVSPLIDPGSPVTTELYLYNGEKYDTIRIGKSSNGFDLKTQRLIGKAGASGFVAGLTLVAMRAATSAVAGACAGRGGSYNGEYCQLPLPDRIGPDIKRLKILSFNVGNAIQSGPHNEPFYCGLYAYKLCSKAVEGKVRDVIANDPPDIIALQEVWNDHCESIDDQPSYWGVRYALEDRVCEKTIKLTSPRQIDRIVPPEYDVQCSPVRKFLAKDMRGNYQSGPAQRYTNGYECVALRRSILSFISKSDLVNVVQPACKGISDPDTYWLGSDTGFQIATAKLLNSTGVAADTEFVIANAHMISPGDENCRALQFQSLYQRFKDSPKRILILGDMNTDPANDDIMPATDLGRKAFSSYFVPYDQTRTDMPVGVRIAYLLSDPAQRTAQMPKLSWTGIQRGSLDHVLSNFADGDCKRGAEVFGVDHLRTICTLTGFDAGQRLRATMHLWDTSAMGPVDYRPWPSGRMTASRRGVRLGYIKTTSGSPIYDSTGMPSDVGIAYTYQACGKGSAQTQITSMPAGGTYSFGVLKFAEWLPICLAP